MVALLVPMAVHQLATPLQEDGVEYQVGVGGVGTGVVRRLGIDIEAKFNTESSSLWPHPEKNAAPAQKNWNHAHHLIEQMSCHHKGKSIQCFLALRKGCQVCLKSEMARQHCGGFIPTPSVGMV